MREEGAARHADVIVVGAGMAGASAAHDLRQGGKSVLILEASDRKGGRIWSDRHDGLVVELGAGWIHFAEWNPLKGLADEYRIATAEFDLSAEQSAFFGPHRQRVSQDTLDERSLAFAAVLASVKEYASELQRDGEEDVSLADGFDAVMDDEGLTPEGRRTIETMRVLALETPLGTESSKASLYHFDDDLNFGSPDLAIPGGYVTIVEKLLEGISIELNAEVTTISETNGGVTIQTGDGRVFTCDHVIVTVSVGVLQNCSITFDPPLPAEKQCALGNLEMGFENKYWFRFDQAFWKDLVGQPRQNIFRLPALPDPLVWLTFFDFTDVCNAPMLMSMQGGDLTVQLESVSDDDVIDSVMPALEWLFGEHAQRPTSVVRSRWVQNRWTRGAYSHLKPGGAPRDRVVLGEPAGRVRFAGEATMRYFPDSVHGAYLSGRREAARILSPDDVADELDAVVLEDLSRELRWLSSPIRRVTPRSVRSQS